MKRWDIIGDVHGSAAALQVLLTRLGYTEAGGVWCHPSRQALFIGDLVDRGPGVGETLTLVRAMVDAGIARAILGNHEYNALCRRHDEAHRPVAGLRRFRMTPQKAREMEPTMEVLDRDPELEAWLLGLPLWLELDGVRFIHAYWGARELAALGGGQTLRACGWDDPVFALTARRYAIERILKGPEATLPASVSFVDKHGTRRDEARIAWWAPCRDGVRFNEILVPPVTALDGVAADAETLASYDPYPADAPPVFIGHYGFRTFPGLLAPNVACVDFGAVGSESIGAYRWAGEASLQEDQFVLS